MEFSFLIALGVPLYTLVGAGTYRLCRATYGEDNCYPAIVVIFLWPVWLTIISFTDDKFLGTTDV